MDTEFRNRAFLPIALPIVILLAIGLLVGMFALILLYNTRESALVLATVMAAAILFGVSLASAQDEMNRRAKVGISIAMGVPLLMGVIVASGALSIDPALLNINRQPHTVIPEDAPTIVATNSQDFESDTMTFPTGSQVGLIFENQDGGTPHNVAIFGLAGEPVADDPEEDPSETIFVGEIITGPAVEPYVFETPAEPGFGVFICSVHPNMRGIVQFEEGAEPSVGGGFEG